jgi:hypothetical protein
MKCYGGEEWRRNESGEGSQGEPWKGTAEGDWTGEKRGRERQGVSRPRSWVRAHAPAQAHALPLPLPLLRPAYFQIRSAFLVLDPSPSSLLCSNLLSVSSLTGLLVLLLLCLRACFICVDRMTLSPPP